MIADCSTSALSDSSDRHHSVFQRVWKQASILSPTYVPQGPLGDARVTPLWYTDTAAMEGELDAVSCPENVASMSKNRAAESARLTMYGMFFTGYPPQSGCSTLLVCGEMPLDLDAGLHGRIRVGRAYRAGAFLSALVPCRACSCGGRFFIVWHVAGV